MSSVSRTRATNLTGLIDIDALVEANLLRQKTKLNSSIQKMKVQEYRQEQYREVIKKSKTFYNKYCDILSGGSLLSSSSYNSIKYSSSNSNLVTATGSSASNVENYKINVEQLATSAKVELKDTELTKGKEMLINGKTFTIKGENTSEIAKNLNADLKESGLNITAKYSQFANSTNGGFVIETKETGEGAGLNIGLNTKKIEVIAGKNATVAAKSESITKDELTANNEIIVNGNTITLEGDTVEKKIESLNQYLKENKLNVSYTYSDKDGLIFTSTEGGTNEGFTIEIGGVPKGISDGEGATKATASIDINSLSNNAIWLNGEKIEINQSQLDDQTYLESIFNGKGVTAKKDGDKLILTASQYGSNGTFTCTLNSTNSDVNKSVIGTNAKVTIENEAGEKITYSDDTKKLTKNEVTIDGTTFKFNGTTGTEGVTLTGKVDGTELKDKIVEFINDYNELLGHINGKLYEEYDRSYLPLTDEDKEGLSDSEIEKLEKKAQTGLLRNDSYLRNFADDMKLTMTTMLKDSGLSLEKIGINPVKDYKASNGLFTIDEDKLLAAIEENPDGIRELFAGKNGIVTKLKDNLYEHATGTFSRLANRAGVADGVTANTNEMTKDIDQRKKLITQMQAALKEKEDALYVRYSSLESSLASLQAQQSSLYSYFQ